MTNSNDEFLEANTVDFDPIFTIGDAPDENYVSTTDRIRSLGPEYFRALANASTYDESLKNVETRNLTYAGMPHNITANELRSLSVSMTVLLDGETVKNIRQVQLKMLGWLAGASERHEHKTTRRNVMRELVHRQGIRGKLIAIEHLGEGWDLPLS